MRHTSAAGRVIVLLATLLIARLLAAGVLGLFAGLLLFKTPVCPGQSRDFPARDAAARRATALWEPKNPHASKMPELQGIVLPGVESRQKTTVAGQVIGPDGKPMPGVPVAVIVYVERPARLDPLPLARGQTDAKGRFLLTARPLSPPRDQNLTVYALAPGLGVSWKYLDIYRSAQETTLRLRPDEPIRGRVVDWRGEPVAGTEVALVTAVLGLIRDENRWYNLTFPAGPSALKPAPVLTDQEGRFVLRGISREMDHFRIRINDRRYAPQEIKITAGAKESREITITATPPRVIEGTLLYGDTKKPAADAELVVDSIVLVPAGPPLAGGFVSGRTDSQGRFRLIPYRGDRFFAKVADSGGRWVALMLPTRAEELFDRKLEILIPEGVAVRTAAGEGAKGGAVSAIPTEKAKPQRGITVIGRALGPQGEPVVKGRVFGTAFLPSRRWGRAVPPIRDGWFSVPDLEPGRKYEVYLCDAEHQWGATTTVSAEDPQPITVRLARCGSATARLVDQPGKPCAHMDVMRPLADIDFLVWMMLTAASPLAGRADLGKPIAGVLSPVSYDPRYWDLRTDADGRVTFPTLIPGAEYRIVSSGEVLVRKSGIPVQVGETADRGDAFILRVSNATQKQFRVRPGETLNLGEARVQRSGAPLQPRGVAFPLGSPAELKAITSKVDQLRSRILPAVVSLASHDGGSGVLVSEEGYVMTAAHCLEKTGQDIPIRLPDGKIVKGKVLGMCRTLDMGLIKITEAGKKWPFVEKGRSGNLQPGAWCVAVGYPGQYNKGPTPVVCIGRIIEAADHKLLFAAPMAGGDSGGPLFDLDGRAVGVMHGMTAVADISRGVAVDAFAKDWDRLVRGESWQTVLPEWDD